MCAGDTRGAIRRFYERKIEDGTLPTQSEADRWVLKNIGNGLVRVTLCMEVSEDILFQTQSQESLEQWVDDLKPVKGRSVRLFRCPKSKCPICLEKKARRRTVCGHAFCPPCILSAVEWSRLCPVCQFPLCE